MKDYYNRGEEAPLYFWRDQHGHEIDLVIDQGLFLDFFEIKSSMTFQKEFMKNIKWINTLQGTSKECCIYGGSKQIVLGDTVLTPWNNLFQNV